jgi:hypothetical protein
VTRRHAAGIALVLAVAGAAACRSNGERPDGPSAPTSPQEVQLTLGQSQRVGGLTVRFDEVSADSRCPLGVQCVWEGDAAVLLTVSEPSRSGAALELHTAGRFPREGTYGRYRVRLVSLEPQPRAGGPVRPDLYRATLLVTGE